MTGCPHSPSARRAAPWRIPAMACLVASFAPAARAFALQDCRILSLDVVALDDLRDGDWKGVEGGLYPGRSNECPADHLDGGRQLAKRLLPLDPLGRPAADGVIVCAAIGFSFTNQVFEAFLPLAGADPEFAPQVRFIDATAPKYDLSELADPSNEYWTDLLVEQLHRQGVSPAQVQVVWILEGVKEPDGAFPDDVDHVADLWAATLVNLHSKLENARLAFLSPVHWQGWSLHPVAEEPRYFEQGFAVREVIARQLAGEPALAWEEGSFRAPWLAWGPYLWTDGVEPRSDGLAMACTDYNWDGSHLSDAGRAKLAARLHHFLKSHRACTPWSVVPGSSPMERMADVERLGGGSAGTNGEPRLAGSAPPTVPHDAEYFVLARDAVPDGNGLIVVSGALLAGDGVAMGDGWLRVQPDLLLPIAFGPVGHGRRSLGQIPDDPALYGRSYYAQLLSFDAAAAKGVALSDAIELRLGD